MINLNIPGGRYDPPVKRDKMDYRTKFAEMSRYFVSTEAGQGAVAKPRVQEEKSTDPKKEEKAMAKENAPASEEKKNPVEDLVFNLKQDAENIATDIAAAIKMLENPGPSEDVEKLKAENEALKKENDEMKTKLASLKSLFSGL